MKGLNDALSAVSNSIAKGLTCQRSQPKLCGGEELPIGAYFAAARHSLIDWIHGADEGRI
ncbi:hypothetical protein [Mesorhizobium prunaredense]|uniref:hypothetical protein n=1 Tax=Mesorhizobium prunaredense TaxID=1631249 RepID=UPI00142E400C|nr:hypothetical protein [Mesorhizobium prunaredense]